MRTFLDTKIQTLDKKQDNLHYDFIYKNLRRGEGERDDHENTLPFVGRVSGHVRLYGESEGRWGGRRETGTKPRRPRPAKGSKGVKPGREARD